MARRTKSFKDPIAIKTENFAYKICGYALIAIGWYTILVSTWDTLIWSILFGIYAMGIGFKLTE